MPTSFTLVHAAGDMFMPAVRRRAIVTEACAIGEVITLSEAVHDHAFIAAVSGFDNYTIGELSILWRSDLFVKVAGNHAQVMRGGRLGPLRIAGRLIPKRLRRARRGPSRLVLWALLRHIETGEQVLVFTHHAIAKADTAHTWRRALRRQGFLNTARVVRAASARFPGVGRLLTGDMNAIAGILAFVRVGLRRVPVPPTLGKRLRYDRIYASGLRVDAVHVFKTAGDHKAVRARVTWGV